MGMHYLSRASISGLGGEVIGGGGCLRVSRVDGTWCFFLGVWGVKGVCDGRVVFRGVWGVGIDGWQARLFIGRSARRFLSWHASDL